MYLSETDKMKLLYLYSTKDRDNLTKYFKMKSKHDQEFTENEKFDFINGVVEIIGHYDIVIYPETSGKILGFIADLCGNKTIMVEKNSKSYIREALLKQKLMKAEKTSLLNVIDNEMGDIFQINKIKGNQRYRFTHILFKDFSLDTKENDSVLVFDDAVFSAFTFSALNEKIDCKHDNIAIFSKV